MVKGRWVKCSFSRNLSAVENVDDNVNATQTFVQVITIFKRLLHYHPKLAAVYKSKKQICVVLDCLNLHSGQILASLLDFLVFVVDTL
jgi:hypothetical protein